MSQTGDDSIFVLDKVKALESAIAERTRFLYHFHNSVFYAVSDKSPRRMYMSITVAPMAS